MENERNSRALSRITRWRDTFAFAVRCTFIFYDGNRRGRRNLSDVKKCARIGVRRERGREKGGKEGGQEFPNTEPLLSRDPTAKGRRSEKSVEFRAILGENESGASGGLATRESARHGVVNSRATIGHLCARILVRAQRGTLASRVGKGPAHPVPTIDDTEMQNARGVRARSRKASRNLIVLRRNAPPVSIN